VVGHGAAEVQQAFAADPDLRFVLQEPQLGTGHAVLQAVPQLDESATTLVLYGDVPLILPATLKRLLAEAVDGVALLTVRLPDPAAMGDRARLARQRAEDVVERDASDEERALVEVNTGILAAPTAKLKAWLATLANDNAQGEYYLTDVIARAVGERMRVVAVDSPDADEALGVNSKEQLAVVERSAQRRTAQALMEQGVTLADPARIDVRGELEVGAEVSIDVGCVFEGRVVLGDGARIGPNNVLRNCEIGAGTEVFGFCYLEGAAIGAHARIGPFARMRPQVALPTRCISATSSRSRTHGWAARRRPTILRTSATRSSATA
jgi:bifunctional UDP-N-acetylglucosamine pyrophosphorylase/glucosamine-1-phosphate N-acetyltransferase